MSGEFDIEFDIEFDTGGGGFYNILLQLKTLLGADSIFELGEEQIAIGDDKVYALGKTPVAVLELTPRLRHIRESFGGGHLHEWHVGVTVGSQWRDAVQGPPALADAWQAVLDRICEYPNLGVGGGGFIREAHVESAQLVPIVEDYGTVKFANVQLVVAITEDVHVSEVE